MKRKNKNNIYISGYGLKITSLLLISVFTLSFNLVWAETSNISYSNNNEKLIAHANKDYINIESPKNHGITFDNSINKAFQLNEFIRPDLRALIITLRVLSGYDFDNFQLLSFIDINGDLDIEFNEVMNIFRSVSCSSFQNIKQGG